MIFVKETVIRASPERVFAFHELPDAIDRLMPEWETARIIKRAESLRIGSTAIIETRILGVLPARWVARHTRYDPPRMFEDVQVEGPFREWRHCHIIEPHEAGAVLRDEINYQPPLSFLGRFAAPYIVVPRLQRLFEFRHAVTQSWCEGQDKG